MHFYVKKKYLHTSNAVNVFLIKVLNNYLIFNRHAPSVDNGFKPFLIDSTNFYNYFFVFLFVQCFSFYHLQCFVD